MRPHVLRDFGFRMICRDPKYNYCKELVKSEEGGYAGLYYDLPDFDFPFFVSSKDLEESDYCDDEDQDLESEDKGQKTAWSSGGGILFCKDGVGYDFSKSDASRFANYC